MNKNAEAPAGRHSNATKMGAWPFEGREVSRKFAVAYVADIVWPDLGKEVARKRVGENVRYACKQGLALTFRGNVVDPEFWHWAKSKWKELGAIPGYPAKLRRQVSESTEGVALASSQVFDFLIPGDLPRAQVELRHCHDVIRQQDRELLRLRQESLEFDEVLRSTLEELHIAESKLATKKVVSTRMHTKRIESGKASMGSSKRRL